MRPGAELLRPGWPGFLRAAQPLLLRRCRLCWRITISVFLAIVAVEAVILLPSYVNFERDRLNGYRDAAVAGFDVAAASERAAATDTTAAERIARRLIGRANVRSVVVLAPGCVVAVRFGAASDELRFSAADCAVPSMTQIDRRTLVVRVPWPSDEFAAAALVVDTAALPHDLWAFVLRIAGLVAIIALSVTAAAMLVLRFLLLGRIVALDAAMEAASHDPGNLLRYRLGRDRRGDELSAMRERYDALLSRLDGALGDLTRREGELRELAASLERKVVERTAQLAAARDAAVRTSDAKSAFLANMSHELRTPLNAVMGFSEAIESELFGRHVAAKYREYARYIRQSGQHLLALVEDILDTTLVEAGKLRLREERVDLGELSAEIVGMMTPQAERAGIALEQAAAWPVVQADRRLLGQALLNLVSNAIKYNKQGGHVQLAAALGPDGVLSIAVRDDGIGIAPANHAAVLIPFGRVEGHLTRTRDGIGLGLPLAKRLIELHGGTLHLASELGRGTTVTLTLPRARFIGLPSPAADGAVSAADSFATS